MKVNIKFLIFLLFKLYYLSLFHTTTSWYVKNLRTTTNYFFGLYNVLLLNITKNYLFLLYFGYGESKLMRPETSDNFMRFALACRYIERKLSTFS